MNHRRNSGFTLIEVIVAIVLSAIALAAILPMLDKVFLLSHEPRTTLQAGLSLQSAMEDLVVWHEAHTNLYDVPPPLEQLRTHVGLEFEGQTVVQNAYVAFTNGLETTVTTNRTLLKIVLRNPLGETAARLFTVPPL